jgi:hypothetical protein
LICYGDKIFIQPNTVPKTGFSPKDLIYSDLFWKYTRQEDWNYIKNMVETQLGELQSYTLKNWQIQKNVKMGDLSGTFVVLIYDTEYELGSGQEKITLGCFLRPFLPATAA